MSFFREVGTDGYDSDANKSEDKPKTIYKNDKPMTLAEMKKAVGGWIEYAHDDGETQIICNEEGKLRGLPYNEEATKLWYRKHHEKYGTPLKDVLVGDVLVLTGKARSI